MCNPFVRWGIKASIVSDGSIFLRHSNVTVVGQCSDRRGQLVVVGVPVRGVRRVRAMLDIRKLGKFRPDVFDLDDINKTEFDFNWLLFEERPDAQRWIDQLLSVACPLPLFDDEIKENAKGEHK